MRKIMQMLGFGEDDEYDDEFDDYQDEPPRPLKKAKPSRKRDDTYPNSIQQQAQLVLFKGIPSEDSKLRLRDLLLDGVMILIDLNGLPKSLEEEGRSFIDFMDGVAFAHKGCIENIEQGQYLVTPRSGMFVVWNEEETRDDGSFDRQGR